MRPQNKLTLALFASLSLCALNLTARGQQERGQAADDVLKINTALVQTGVTVTDKQGRFVEGLRKEEFELKVDGRTVPVSFFESILAGTQREQQVRGVPSSNQPPVKAYASTPSFRRRTIIFFLDDAHLSLDSLGRTRKILLDFIDKQMGENDLVAIASSSGQIGFLQQFTENKDVLRAAVARLSQVPYVVQDYGKNPGAPMTEYMALTIERKDDNNVFEFYVQDCMKWALKGVSKSGRGSREQCEVEVKSRARQILTEAGAATRNTYYSLETLLNSAERMPGSKLAFFISDGFLADTGPRGPIASDKLSHITDEARRAGVVIYSIDARGLVSGNLDATGDVPFDADGRLEAANLRAISATQDAMNALASDTGGRALRNQAYFDRFITTALEETSRYYLLAWRPEAEDEKNEKLRKIEVTVTGRPDLVVRFARSFYGNRAAVAPASEARETKEEKGATNQTKKPDSDLSQALADFYPRQALPLQLSLIYLDTPATGTVLTSSIQAPTDTLSYGAQDKEAAQLTLVGVILNDQGKPAATFKTGLKVSPPSSDAGGRNASTVIYNYPTPLKPGIYQVRVAARDNRSGVVGSSMQWIVIPDLSTRQLSLSSLIVGIQTVANSSAGAVQIQWSVDKKFEHGSRLRFMTFIYNAARTGGAPPNLFAQVQVYRDGRAVITTPFNKVETDAQTDPARVPFTAEINLGTLQPGRYLLQVTIEDRITRKTVSQRSAFDVQ